MRNRYQDVACNQLIILKLLFNEAIRDGLRKVKEKMKIEEFGRSGILRTVKNLFNCKFILRCQPSEAILQNYFVCAFPSILPAPLNSRHRRDYSTGVNPDELVRSLLGRHSREGGSPEDLRKTGFPPSRE
jgi:hypothetical protein